MRQPTDQANLERLTASKPFMISRRLALSLAAGLVFISITAGAVADFYLNRFLQPVTPQRVQPVAMVTSDLSSPDPKVRARIDALVSIYRSGHLPLTPENLAKMAKNEHAAYLAEEALKREDPWALTMEQDRERNEEKRATQSELNQLVTNQQSTTAGARAAK